MVQCAVRELVNKERRMCAREYMYHAYMCMCTSLPHSTVYVYPCRHVRVYVLVHTHDTCLCMY